MQYSVYANPSAKSRSDIPFVVDIQSELLSGLSTRMVVPLAHLRRDKSELPQRLCPAISVGGTEYMLLPYQAAPLLKAHLKDCVANVKFQATAIVDAMDCVISGI